MGEKVQKVWILRLHCEDTPSVRMCVCMCMCVFWWWEEEEGNERREAMWPPEAPWVGSRFYSSLYPQCQPQSMCSTQAPKLNTYLHPGESLLGSAPYCGDCVYCLLGSPHAHPNLNPNFSSCPSFFPQKPVCSFFLASSPDSL